MGWLRGVYAYLGVCVYVRLCVPFFGNSLISVFGVGCAGCPSIGDAFFAGAYAQQLHGHRGLGQENIS